MGGLTRTPGSGQISTVKVACRSAVLAIAALATSAVALTSCTFSNDPDSFVIEFRNDLDQPVYLALCNSAHSENCDNPHYRKRIAAGASSAQNISPDVRTEWAVESADGEMLRCVVLYWRHYQGHDMKLGLAGTPAWSNPCQDSTALATERG